MTTCLMCVRQSSECKSHTAGNVSGPSISSLTYMSSETTSSLWTSSWCRWSHSWCWPPLTSPVPDNPALRAELSAGGPEVGGQAEEGPGHRRHAHTGGPGVWAVQCHQDCHQYVWGARWKIQSTSSNIFCRWLCLVIQGLGYGDWPDWCSQLSHVSNILLVLNSSVNIVIYCWKDPSFRNWIISTKFYRVSFCPLSTFLSFRMSFWDKETTYFKVMDKTL